MYHLQNNACGALESNIQNSGRGVYWSEIKAADIPAKARLWEQLESSKQTDKKKKKPAIVSNTLNNSADLGWLKLTT